MRRTVTVLLLAAVATVALGTPINTVAEQPKQEARIVPVAPAVAEARSLPSSGVVALPAQARSGGPLHPSPVDPLQKRDGAHHGSGGHGIGGIASTGTSSYASAPNSFIGGSGGHAVGFSSSGGGGGFGGSGGHHGGGGGGFGGSGSSYSSGAISNHIVGSSGSGHGHGGGGGYGAPAVQPSYGAAPEKQTGYYYYYYPVQVNDEGGDKKGEKGFMDKMKKMFEPMMYPWNAMMEYFGYGDDYDYDYDYEGYGTYARSMVSRASEYVPWEAVNELSNVVTQDQCVEFFVCQLGSYGREYRNMHFLLDYVIPEDDTNSYTRSFKDSVLKKTNCDLYNCPLFRRRQGTQDA